MDNDVLAELGSLEEWFSSMAAAHQVEHIRFNSDLTIPDLNGRNIQVLAPRSRYLVRHAGVRRRDGEEVSMRQGYAG